MRLARLLAITPLLLALGADDPKPKRAKPQASSLASSAVEIPAAEFDAKEAEALAFVRENHAELATVLEALRPLNPLEYRKAILELQGVALDLSAIKRRNPARHSLELDSWKAKSRVELLAAQLAHSPDEELKSQLRTAIEAKVDVDLLRHRFDLKQAEAAAKRAREAIDRLESHRDAIVEGRYRSLQPKKSARSKKAAAVAKTPPKDADQPAKEPNRNPTGEDRR